MEGNHLQGARVNAQVDTSRTVSKRLWKDIIVAKIRMQQAVLVSEGGEAGAFDALCRKVRSGDPDNVEAQAARRYWPLLMGPEFRRDRAAEGANALLNYGYTVLRAVVARAICAAGLHPTIGLHHANRGNAFALADDLMEPYRPLVDRAVLNLLKDGADDVCPEAKRQLVALTTLDLATKHGLSPLINHAARLAQHLAQIYTGERKTLELPVPPDPLALASIGHKSDDEVG
jgi:CRISPR-associated protein Cas1